jgi:hypothetical protein
MNHIRTLWTGYWFQLVESLEVRTREFLLLCNWLMRMLTQCAELWFKCIRDIQIWRDMSVFAQTSGLHARSRREPMRKQCSRGNKGIMHALNVEFGSFRSNCPKNKGAKVRQTGRAPGICLQCGKGRHWVKECKHKPGYFEPPGARKRGKGSAPDHNLLKENSLWG